MSDESILEPHPLAGLFPLMGRDENEELQADILRNGLRMPIVLFEERILDGRNRYLACKEVGILPHFVNYEGDDPEGVVASLNLQRRHLNPSQRTMIAARLADSQPGGDRTKPQNCGLSHGRAAARFKVSKRLVDLASALLNAVASGQSSRLVEQVSNGEMSLNKAMRLLKLVQLNSSSLRASQSRHANEIVIQAERLCRRMDSLSRMWRRPRRSARISGHCWPKPATKQQGALANKPSACGNPNSSCCRSRTPSVLSF